ncbi:hypothetical protein NQ317_007785 [Molorchus minor]|uniref:Uncharacterized protein n=1 Tax=Molorchus minor TaxID=1323400 RepID=A0ABQ9JX17_9CUCU|nr:hypothetical protein NQ317_007785 [Molorchus minor]
MALAEKELLEYERTVNNKRRRTYIIHNYSNRPRRVGGNFIRSCMKKLCPFDYWNSMTECEAVFEW